MLLPDDEIMSAIHRHERHYCHYEKKTPYLCPFFSDGHCDGEVTVDGHRHRDRHTRSPYLRGYDAHDGDDSELQRLSKLAF